MYLRPPTLPGEPLIPTSGFLQGLLQSSLRLRPAVRFRPTEMLHGGRSLDAPRQAAQSPSPSSNLMMMKKMQLRWRHAELSSTLIVLAGAVAHPLPSVMLRLAVQALATPLLAVVDSLRLPPHRLLRLRPKPSRLKRSYRGWRGRGRNWKRGTQERLCFTYGGLQS